MGIVTEAGFYNGKFLKVGQFAKAEETGVTAEDGGAVDRDAMTKDELLSEAERRGVAVKPSDTKAEILAAIGGD